LVQRDGARRAIAGDVHASSWERSPRSLILNRAPN
jgi:hypothetical protein